MEPGMDRMPSRATVPRWSCCGSPASGELSTEALPSPGGWEQRALPLADGRVALTGSTVTLVDVG